MSLSKSFLPYYECVVDWSRAHPRLASGILASSLALLYCVGSKLSGPRLPPGPIGLPLVGNMFSLSEKTHLDFARLRERYGDVFTIWLGREPLIVFSSYDTIKEAFLTRGTDFAGRPASVTLWDRESFPDEIFMAPFNEKWARDKKFALTCLRTLGGIKAGADGSVVEEMAALINKLQALNQTPVDIKEMTLNLTTNVISGIIFNERMEHDDPKLQEFRQLVDDFNEALNAYSLLDFILPEWMARLFSRSKFKEFKATQDRFEAYIAQRVAEHRLTFDASSPRDFVDMYLSKPDLEIGRPFYCTIIAFTADAVSSMAVFMRWIVLYLGHHPQIQAKVQAEIDGVVGASQMVTIAERPRLKYTEAVLLEVMRISDCSVGSSYHRALAHGTTFRGYDIPTTCNVIGDFYAVHKDPTLFPDPERFDPERFLDADGGIVNSNLVIPFGVGRRMCLGESLSKLELFLFLANVLHQFTIRFPADEPMPPLEPAGGFIQFPHPYKAIFVPRDA